MWTKKNYIPQNDVLQMEVWRSPRVRVVIIPKRMVTWTQTWRSERSERESVWIFFCGITEIEARSAYLKCLSRFALVNCFTLISKQRNFTLFFCFTQGEYFLRNHSMKYNESLDIWKQCAIQNSKGELHVMTMERKRFFLFTASQTVKVYIPGDIDVER